MTDATTPDPDEINADSECDDVPAAAGGRDDSEPAQGEGAPNSY